MSSPTADIVFELVFPKLAPTDLRVQIRKDGGDLIEKHAPSAVRKNWLGLPFNTDPTPAAVLEHVQKCFAQASPDLTASPADAFDTYCWHDVIIICYFDFAVHYKGAPLVCASTAAGLEVHCPLHARLIYKPA